MVTTERVDGIVQGSTLSYCFVNKPMVYSHVKPLS